MAYRVFEGFAQSLIRFANAKINERSLKRKLLIIFPWRGKELWRDNRVWRDFLKS